MDEDRKSDQHWVIFGSDEEIELERKGYRNSKSEHRNGVWWLLMRKPLGVLPGGYKYKFD